MKHHKQILVDGITFDSSEEVSFYHWLNDAVRAGMVSGYTPHPMTFTLCEPVMCDKISYKELKKEPFLKKEVRNVTKVRQYVYTPDFLVSFTKEFGRYYPDEVILDEGLDVLVDVKGEFSRGKNNTSGITFGIKSAWLYHTQGILVQKVVPSQLFKSTWIPEQCRVTRVKKTVIEKFNTPDYKSFDQAVEWRANREKLLRVIEHGDV